MKILFEVPKTLLLKVNDVDSFVVVVVVVVSFSNEDEEM